MSNWNAFLQHTIFDQDREQVEGVASIPFVLSVPALFRVF
jgi:hypothetical protein